MSVLRARARSCLLVFLALLVGGSHQGVAGAAVVATGRSATVSTTTATWSAVLSSSGLLSGATGALSTLLTGDSYPNLTNAGTADLGIGFQVVLAVSTTGGGAATLSRCSGTWNQVAGSCSGTETTVATVGASGMLPATLVDLPGQTVRLRLHPAFSTLGQTASLSATVTSL